MLEFVKEYWLEFAFGIITANLAGLIARHKKTKAENKCLKSAIRALLRDRIIVMYNRYTEKHYFPIYERENLAHLTKEYYALGGNGVICELEARLNELPTEKPRDDS